jgi:Hydroxymethylpyrimidine/phosphomethylpyrimidine kinase
MTRRQASPPVVLTIAGSDNSCGAGIQADLKTFGAYDVYGLTAVTCVVSEVPGRVEKVQAVSPGVLRSQIRILFEAYPIVAVKTGMLYSRALLRVVSEELADRLGMFHLVVDPVMVASSGDPLLKKDAVRAYEEEILPPGRCHHPQPRRGRGPARTQNHHAPGHGTSGGRIAREIRRRRLAQRRTPARAGRS